MTLLRKIFWWTLLLLVIAAAVYAYMTYTVIALWDPDSPKVSYLILLEKPQRDFSTVFYNYIDKEMYEREVARYTKKNQEPPWYLDYDWTWNNEIYHFTMDNRQFAPD